MFFFITACWDFRDSLRLLFYSLSLSLSFFFFVFKFFKTFFEITVGGVLFSLFFFVRIPRPTLSKFSAPFLSSSLLLSKQNYLRFKSCIATCNSDSIHFGSTLSTGARTPIKWMTVNRMINVTLNRNSINIYHLFSSIISLRFSSVRS